MNVFDLGLFAQLVYMPPDTPSYRAYVSALVGEWEVTNRSPAARIATQTGS